MAYHKLYPEIFMGSLFASPQETEDVREKKKKLIQSFLKDDYCHRMITQMNEAGIEKSVLLIVDDNEFLGQKVESIEQNYERHHGVLKEYPERFLVFAGFHPHRSNGLSLLRKGIEEYGFSGIKLYPPFGFRLDDAAMHDCYKYANERKLPILIHTGYSIKELVNENANPAALLPVVDKYPQAKFIMAHAGFKLNDPVIAELLKKNNVYADIAGFQNASKEHLPLIFDPLYNEKILFGSDWPISGLLNNMKTLKDQFIVFSQQLNQKQEFLDRILFKNAHKLLGLNND